MKIILSLFTLFFCSTVTPKQSQLKGNEPLAIERPKKQNTACNKHSVEIKIQALHPMPSNTKNASAVLSINQHLFNENNLALKDSIACLPIYVPQLYGMDKLKSYQTAGSYQDDFGHLLTLNSINPIHYAQQTTSFINRSVHEKTRSTKVDDWVETDGYIVDMYYNNQPISTILDDLARQSGISILFDQDTSATLSLNRKKLSLTKALNMLSKALSAIWDYQDNFITFISPDNEHYEKFLSHHVYRPSYLTAEALVKLIPTHLQSAAKQTADASEIVISASPPDIKTLLAILNSIDTKPPLIALEAIIVDIEQQETRKLGIDWWSGGHLNFSNDQLQFGITGTKSGFSLSAHNQIPSLSWAGISSLMPITSPLKFLTQSIHALSEKGLAHILATPNVITASGKVARINIETQQIIPILSGSSNYPQVITKSFSTGVNLEITPVLSKNGDIQLTIHNASVGTLTLSGAAQADGKKLPVVTKREISTSISLSNEQILAIGGLLDASANEHQKHFPNTSIGTKEKNKKVRNLMIFIKPTILNQGLKDKTPWKPIS